MRFDQQDHATPTTRPTDLARQSALASRAFDDAVDRLGGNRRQIPLTEAPFLAHQAAGSGPVGLFERCAQFLSNFRDPCEIVENAPAAIDMCLKDIPVVDGRLPRVPGVAQYQ